MKVIVYSRADGFQDVDEPFFDWEDNESHEEYLLRLGFEPCPVSDSPDSVSHFRGIKVHRAESTDSEWQAIVVLYHVDTWENIVVKSPADLLCLRMALLPLHGISALHQLDDLTRLANRALCWGFKHNPNRKCWDCDPDEMEFHASQERRAREKRAESNAEQKNKPDPN